MSATAKWRLFAALAGALLAIIVVVAIAVDGDDHQAGASGLTVERGKSPGSGAPELVVSVPRKLNVPRTARDGRTVVVECLDAGGRRVAERRQAWPFMEEEGYPLPHIHLGLTSLEVGRVARCRLRGTTRRLEGRLRLRG